MASVPSTPTFLASYPEFAAADPTLINAKLLEAAQRTNEAVYTTTHCTQAVMLRGAILLAKSPFGRDMRAENKDQISTWETELKQLQRAATFGMRVF